MLPLAPIASGLSSLFLLPTRSSFYARAVLHLHKGKILLSSDCELQAAVPPHLQVALVVAYSPFHDPASVSILVRKQ